MSSGRAGQWGDWVTGQITIPRAVGDDGLDKVRPGGALAVVTNVCDPSMWEMETGGPQELRASLGNIGKFKDSLGYVRS